MSAVCRRHVLGHGRMFAFKSAARVRGDTFAAMQDLDAVAGDTDVDFLAYQLDRKAHV